MSRPRAEQGTADEIFFGRKPCLMVVEQHSLCWLSGRLADKRDGEEWAKEFRQLPQLRQLTRDAGQGLAKGLALVNAERRAEGREPVADQEDHFHALREGGRALRRMQGRAARLLAKAEAAQRAADERSRQRGDRSKFRCRPRAQERLSVSFARSDSHVSLAAWQAAVVQRRKG